MSVDGGKKVSNQAIIGETGINLIQRIVLGMGCGWHPTNQAVEVGIDGEIELVHPDTRVATNSIVRVQSRATVRPFTSESETGFEYICERRELDYWLSGNTPVILVVSRPHLDEAYWVSIKDYFNSPDRLKERRILFDKATMRFRTDALRDLFNLAVPRTKGLYIAPTPRQEPLFTNLLTIIGRPERLWLARTELRKNREVFDLLGQSAGVRREFTLQDKTILTVHDLTEPEWRGVVDRGSVEEFPGSEWADSTDVDMRRRYVGLLNQCLNVRCTEIGLVLRRDDDAYFFRAPNDLSPLKVPFRSVKEQTERTVFQPYYFTAGKRIGQLSYYRHFACFLDFKSYEGDWFLQVNPTYHFTSDGKVRHPKAHEFLSGIKRQEKQGAVMYQLVMWAALLRGSGEGDEDGLPANTYPHLRFGDLRTFAMNVGIDDKAWLPNEDSEITKEGEQTLGDLPLFRHPDQGGRSDLAT